MLRPCTVNALARGYRISNKSPFLRHAFWSTPPRKEEPLAGTVPHHLSYVILHHPKPPVEYPPKIDKSFSPLYRALLLAAARRQAVVNFGWRDDIHAEGQDAPHTEESYPATIFSTKLRHRAIELPAVSLANLATLERILEDPAVYLTQKEESAEEKREIHLYVCTHGSRDCRCGEKGGRLVAALRMELARRQKHEATPGNDEHHQAEAVWNRVRIGELAHVGGHKHAGNLLMFPFGDWLGLLDAEHAADILDVVAARANLLESQGDLVASPAIMVGHWRGRMGLDKEEQLRHSSQP